MAISNRLAKLICSDLIKAHSRHIVGQFIVINDDVGDTRS